ncbi:insulinase family protein [Paraglaciecola sp.]|uniref:insulinase family protein n=1 Tax=Paraglaciecola sp. TaxID=1920173 RepID=UPI0030F388A0
MSHFYFLLPFIALLLLGACQTAPQATFTSPDKGLQDPAEYRALTLPNGMKLLVVSDKQLLSAYGALAVNAGYFNDPDELPGLAHLYEHMLSKGSAAYPEIAEYKKFLADNGGKSNASTSAFSSNYYFQVNTGQLQPALQRFSAQFIHPLIPQTMVYKERHAVDAEFQLKFQDKGRRKREVLRQLVDVNHPYRHFSTGNIDTLQDTPDQSLHQALLQFSKDFYCAPRMAAVIAAPEEIDTLLGLARQAFANLPSHCAQELTSSPEPFTQNLAGKTLDIQSLSKQSLLTMSFVVPDNQDTTSTLAAPYMQWLIESNHANGLVAHLKSLNLIKSLNTSSTTIDEQRSLFNIEFRLTDSGWEQPHQVLAAAFDYVDSLKQQALDPNIFAIYHNLQLQAFNQKSSHKGSSEVRSLATRLLFEPAAHLLSNGQVAQQFSATTLQHWLHYLSPDQLLVIREHKTLPTGQTKTEAYYQTRYQINSPINFTQQHYPYQLPKTLRYVKPASSDKILNFTSATQLNASSDITTWYLPKSKVDDSYAAVTVYIDQPTDKLDFAYLNPLLAKHLRTNLAVLVNQAQQAKISVDISDTQTGLRLHIYGRNGDWPLLMQELLQGLQSVSSEQSNLTHSIKDQLGGLQNFAKQRLKEQSNEWLEQQLNFKPKIEGQIAFLKQLKHEYYTQFVSDYLQQAHLTVFYSGHILQSDQLNIDGQIASLAHNRSQVSPAPTSSALSPLKLDSRNNSSGDSAVQLFQLPADNNLKSLAALHVLASTIKAPFFNQLRTQEQLGYSVQAGLKKRYGHTLLNFYVQSPKATATELYTRIIKFNLWYRDYLLQLSPEQFNTMQYNASVALSQLSLNTASATQQMRLAIRTGKESNNNSQMQDAINALQLDQFKLLANEILLSPLYGILSDDPTQIAE